MNSEIRKTEVDLDGLLEILGENLYSTPVVVIRELIQNCHDAVVRRKVESGWIGKSRIDISVDEKNNTLTVKDVGSGLTKDEIVKYLATIGSGYTRVLRNRSQDEIAVGYFGLGFLTAYVVSELVEFYTTSYQEFDKGWHFSSKGGQRYALKSIESMDIGSTVVLHLKEEFYSLCDTEFLYQIISKYCCLLPIDIYLEGWEEPINSIEVPWRLAEQNASTLRLKKSGLEFANLFDNTFDAIAAFPLKGTDECPFQGILWFQDGAYYASSDNRVTSIFIRSMHITDECKELLPEWAGFVGCVIDTPILTPTASRESVRDDQSFLDIKQLIRDQLITILKNLSSEMNADWRRIVFNHNQSLLGAAVSDAGLFDALSEQLTLPTTEGDFTVNEIIQKSPDKCLQLIMEVGSGYEQLVSKSLRIPVIHGYKFAVMRFCKLLNEYKNIQIVTLGSTENAKNLFPETDIDVELKEKLLDLFSIFKCKTIVSSFEPQFLPLLQVVDQDALLKKRVESDQMDKKIGTAALMMAREFTKEIEVENESYLYVNYSNQVIQQLLNKSIEKQSAFSQLLINFVMIISDSRDSNKTNDLESFNDQLLKILEV